MRRCNVGGAAGTRASGILIVIVAAACLLAPSASAELVRVGKHQLVGIMPIRGASPGALPRAGTLAPATVAADNGDATYHGGPVLHGSTPYLIFWDPNNELSATVKGVVEQYFADVAADSGLSSNVYGLLRQYTDTSGFADYQQVWSASHAITDTQPYPTTGQCTENNGAPETACLFDAQIRAEVSRLIAADGLPTGVTGNAPIYFVLTPPDVNSCMSDNKTCADKNFCGYHQQFTDNNQTVLYSYISTLLANDAPKACQADGNALVQQPNGSQVGDIAARLIEHEDEEAITDPIPGRGWVDGADGFELADNCAATGSLNPSAGTNPNAFLPTLGGSASSGTLFDQLIHGDKYYLQSAWSNGDTNCELRPTTQTLTAQFNVPSAVGTHEPVTLDPSASSSTGGYSSTTWDFGDNSSSFSTGAPTSVTHAYTTPGTYTAKLTLVDTFGNLASVVHTFTTLTAAFTSAPSHPEASDQVSFDGSGSLEPGGSIAGYSWEFGDGSTGTGASPTHTYDTPGDYLVSLTVSDGSGNTDTVSHTVSVHGPPVASFDVTTANPTADSAVSFDASGSNEAHGSIMDYVWDFGDGSSDATGVSPTHTYAAAGTYTVTLTVDDAFGNQAVTQQQVTVASVPSANFTSSPAHPESGTSITFDGSGSTDTGAAISSYSWDFGDGSQLGSGQKPTHTYSSAGVYTVTLTITDQTQNTATKSQMITVHGPPVASFNVTTASPKAGSSVAFDGSGSSEAHGSIASYSWDFGDGSTALGLTSGQSHVYSEAGTYTVTLTVTDSFGEQATTSKTVTVASIATAAFTITPGQAKAGASVSFDGSKSKDVGSTISNYTWNFGDGSPAGGGVSPTHTYAAAGTYMVTMTVTDAFGSMATSSKTVTVVGIPSAAFTVDSTSPLAGTLVSMTAATSTDLGSPISSYSWNFGDGAAGSGATASHSYSRPGTYTVTLTITDGSGQTSTTTRTVNVRNPSITAVAVKKGRKVERIAVTVDAPGTVTLGSKRVAAHNAGKLVLKIKLTKAQRKRLRARHSLTVKLRLKFVPTLGNATSRTVTIKIKG